MIEDDDLIKLALQDSGPDPFSDLPETVAKFFHSIAFEASDKDRVPGLTIFWVYKRWCLENQFKFVDRREFNAILKQLNIRSYPSNGERVYCVKKKPFELSTEEYLEMRKDYRLAKGRLRNKQRGKEKVEKK